MRRKMICACCGFEIIGVSHKVKSGFVCDKCWNDRNLFFPEKMLSGELKELDSKATVKEKAYPIKSMRVPVIRMKQKDITLFVGKLKARAVLMLYGISVFEEDTLNGYQREIYENEVDDLYEYITECPIAVMPSLFISLREGADFTVTNSNSSTFGEDIGMLEIPMNRGAIWIIDGQHRIGCFDRALSEIGHLKNENSSESNAFSELMNYELPVIFVDSRNIAANLNEINKTQITPVDIERTIFYIINRTQKRIPASLKDTLQYCIKKSGVNGIPIIEREEWRTIAASIAIRINQREHSPLERKINISGARGRNEPIRLNSFVSSLRLLFLNRNFTELDFDKKTEFLVTYWKVVREMNEKAFREETRRDYLLLKAIGIYSLNALGSDYLQWCRDRGVSPINQKYVRAFLGPIRNFDWNRSTSPFAHFSGMSGVKKIHGLLLEAINEKNKNLLNNDGGNIEA